jgi:hypothetical protein
MDRSIEELMVKVSGLVDKYMMNDKQLEVFTLLDQVSSLLDDNDTQLKKVELENGNYKALNNKMVKTLVEKEHHIEELRDKIVKYNTREAELLNKIQALESAKVEHVTKVESKENGQAVGAIPAYHLEKVKAGNLAFKDKIPTSEIVKLYLNYGMSALKIEECLNEGRAIKIVTRQTIVNRLKRIGLWNNKERWMETERTAEEKDYMRRHGIRLDVIQ